MGTWRSFKIFKNSGDIRLHNEMRFQEFQFTQERLLIITLFQSEKKNLLARTNQWNITLKNKKHFLDIGNPKMQYEVVTVNHTILVLSDISAQEKTFFARENVWSEYIKTSKSVIL